MSTSLRPLQVEPVAVGTLTGPTTRLLGAPTPAVTGVTLDSRRVRPGDLYAALPGARVHGARFVPQALGAGAVAVLTDTEGLDLCREHGVAAGRPDAPDTAAGHRADGVPVLLDEDPRAVLGEISARVYGRPANDLICVGITGTNGKTTTAHLLDGAWTALGRRTGLVGTIETRVGQRTVRSERTTPEACDLHGLLALMREEGVDVLTMEVSSHALALHRVDGVRYQVAVFTNLSQDHLDFHDGMEGYFAAKASLFTPARSRAGVVCVDDEWGVRLAAQAGVPVWTVSNRTDREADWRIEAAPGESTFVLTHGGRESGSDTTPPRAHADEAPSTRLRLTSSLPGDFNRTNTALAALVLLCSGVPADDVERALAAPTRVPGRAESVDLGSGAPKAIVDFAHTPDAVAALLRAVRASITGPLVAVLGAGGDRDPGKRPAMGAAAAAVADHVVITDDNPRREDPAAIRAALLSGAVDTGGAPTGVARTAVAIAGRDEALAAALELAGEDGLVAVLGKGHENGQEIDGVIHPYDDRDALARAWSRLTEVRP